MKGMPGRLAAALGRDLLVQYRARYLVPVLASLAVWTAALRFIHPDSGFDLAPAFLFLNTYLLAFSLGAWQAVCEREEGVLSALDLTPLRPHELLAARSASLSLAAAIQNPLIALAAGRPIASWPSLLLGVCGETAILSLAAFLAVAYVPPRWVPAARLPAAVLFLAPPLLPMLACAPGSWLIVHPLQGPLLLLQGAFLPLPGRVAAAALAGSAIWVAVLLIGCRKGLAKMRSRPLR